MFVVRMLKSGSGDHDEFFVTVILTKQIVNLHLRDVNSRAYIDSRQWLEEIQELRPWNLNFIIIFGFEKNGSQKWV